MQAAARGGTSLGTEVRVGVAEAISIGAPQRGQNRLSSGASCAHAGQRLMG
jgi:hypothetical protein